MRPYYLMMVGLPASGKSTLAAALHRVLPDAAYISSDAYIESKAAERGQTYGECFHELIEEAGAYAREETRNALTKGRHIIHDQTNLTKKSRKSKLVLIPPSYIKAALSVSVREDIRKERLAARSFDKFIPPDVDERMQATFMFPHTEEGFHTVMGMPGDGELDGGLRAVIEVMNYVSNQLSLREAHASPYNGVSPT